MWENKKEIINSIKKVNENEDIEKGVYRLERKIYTINKRNDKVEIKYNRERVYIYRK